MKPVPLLHHPQSEKDCHCVLPEFPMVPFVAIALLTKSARAENVCLLPSWCSCRQPSGGPSLLCARGNSPLCLSLCMMPLQPLATWALSGLEPPWFLRLLLKWGPHLGTRCVQSGLARVQPGRDHPRPAGSHSLWHLPQCLGPFPQGWCCASPPQPVLGVWGSSFLGHSFAFLPRA